MTGKKVIFYHILIFVLLLSAGRLKLYAQVGSTCSNPYVITTFPFTQTGMTTCGFGNNYTSTDACGSSYMNGDDFLYQYTPSVTQTVSLALTGTDTWVGLFVYNGCPSAMGTVCVSSNTNSSGNPSIGSVTLTAGTTYYFMIDTWPAPQCTPFNFSLNAPPPPNNQDCQGAIPVCQNTYTQSVAYSGTGNITNEINSSISCLGSGEKNDVWYIFTVQVSGNLCFSITPNVLTDDYDWAVYNLTNANCSDIYTNAGLEMSCNYSGTSGVTGANGQPGVQNNPCIAVTAGQTYVLNVSQFSTSTNGYTLSFSASTAVIFDNIAPYLSTLNTVTCGQSQLTFTFSETILCSTVQNADFQLTGSGGPYTVSGVTGATCLAGGTMENTFTINVSPAISGGGSYSFCLVTGAGLVTDLCGNIASPTCLSFTLPAPPVASILSSTNILCFGQTNGSATASVTGGTAPLTYSWSPSGGTGLTANNLAPGTYTFTVTDANSCVDTAMVTITQPPALTLTTSKSMSVCTCTCVGVANVFPSGGTPNYTVLWSNGYNDQFQNGLCNGTYTVTVTDANGCVSTASVTIP